jgi:hypothetical protein
MPELTHIQLRVVHDETKIIWASWLPICRSMHALHDMVVVPRENVGQQCWNYLLQSQGALRPVQRA